MFLDTEDKKRYIFFISLKKERKEIILKILEKIKIESNKSVVNSFLKNI